MIYYAGSVPCCQGIIANIINGRMPDLNEAAGTADACGVRGSGPVGALSDSVGYRERRSL